MIFQFFSVLVPIILFIVLPRYFHDYPEEKQARPWLFMAGALFCIAYYLPSPIIDGMDTHFWTHFIGGGIFSSVLLVYIMRAMGARYSEIEYGIRLFILVSTLGVMNELAEFVLVKLHISQITLADTSWDLVTNTLGAGAGWLMYIIWDRYDSRHR